MTCATAEETVLSDEASAASLGSRALVAALLQLQLYSTASVYDVKLFLPVLDGVDSVSASRTQSCGMISVKGQPKTLFWSMHAPVAMMKAAQFKHTHLGQNLTKVRTVKKRW